MRDNKLMLNQKVEGDQSAQRLTRMEQDGVMVFARAIRINLARYVVSDI